MWNRVECEHYLVESTSGKKIWVDRSFFKGAAAMTIAEAIKILREYNEWRRGDDSEMIDPAIIGKAIDMVCDYADEKGEL